MQNKDKGDGIEDSPLDMLLVILLEGASKEVVTPSSKNDNFHAFKRLAKMLENEKSSKIVSIRSDHGREF